jgi:hypothetical protein
MSFQWDEQKLTLDISLNEQKALRIGLVPWEQISTLLADVLPPPITTGTTQNPGAGIAMPEPFTYMRAESVHIEPQVPDKITNSDNTYDFDTLNQYENALVTITYSTPKYSVAGLDGTNGQEFNPDPVELLEHRWSIGAEFLTIPPTTAMIFLNSGDPVPEDVPLAKRIPITEMQITWPRVLSPPFAAMRSAIGKTNSSAMTFATGTCAIGTLLFVGAEVGRQVLSDGSRAWQLGYRFSERNVTDSTGQYQGWNVVWNPIGGEWGVIVGLAFATNEFPYEKTNLNTLFAPSQSG